ncbi:hypothetical protein ACIO1C_15405 [Streptomyces sp. NPDC087420]|uniref:hypothetical protein n=1 Tax=Streptomyces sp. NPDC087420 TaxID=3365785 RepID=UPI003838E378
MIAGPCAVETPEQTLEAARMAMAAGASLLRGGAFKPRTDLTILSPLRGRTLTMPAGGRVGAGR